MQITGLNHINLSVRNLKESFEFYRDFLGFKPLMKTRTIAYLLAGDLWLCLEEDKEIRSAPLPEYTHIAFSVSSSDFPEFVRKLRSFNAKIWKENNSEGESLYFLDPNGHKLEIHVGDWKSRIADTKNSPWEENIEFFV